MNIGIMQPYFFPYIGYWQLMALTDRYVIYDDVRFIKGGWINRNRILQAGAPAYINLPLRRTQGSMICEYGVAISPVYLRKMANRLTCAYRRAPFFDEVYPALWDMLAYETDSLPDYLENTIRKTARRLGISTEFIRSSKLAAATDLHGQDRVIAICRRLGATTYYNAIGGRELYSYAEFEKAGINLRFVETGDIRYPQITYGNEQAFFPNLSIIDVLMNTGWEGTQKLLSDRIIHGGPT